MMQRVSKALVLLFVAWLPAWVSAQTPPSVSVTSPYNGRVFNVPASIDVVAGAWAGSNSIVKVELFNGTTLIGTDTTAPYQYTWSNVPPGTYALTAKATDSAGMTASGQVTIRVNGAPAVSLTSPVPASVHASPAVVSVSASASDGDGTIGKVMFFNGASQIGTAWSAPYSYTWSGVVAGTYSLTAQAVDNDNGVTTSTPVTIIVSNSPPPNAAPTVTLSAPSTGASFSAPASINLAANAADNDGSIAKVEFFSGTTLLGSDTSAPYSFTWTNVPAGSYTLTAKATDNNGASTTSTAASVTVTATSNAPPSVTLTNPPSGATFAAPATVTLGASASDTDGSITKVEFFSGTTLIGSDTSAPYAFTWSSVPAGSYSVTAKATDNAGASTTSGAVPITVSGGNAAPSVRITDPAGGAVYPAPAIITLTAEATDSDGSIDRVRFYNGNFLLGSDTSAPYTYTWNDLAAGTYTVTVKATDNQGETSAASVSFTVAAPYQPSAGAPAGTTAGTFQISPSGAATYTIPIQVPPGTAGVAPALSLSYSSQSGNGLLGVGWSLGGLSAITRCPRTIAQDGATAAVSLDANDRFCLDGRRLVAIAGTYGANGTEYRTEIETYAKIVSYGSAGSGPAWFKVWTKSGQLVEYGNSTDSRIEAKGLTTVRTWAANKVADSKGNYLTLTYAEDNAKGEFYPTRIDYTGNAGASLVPFASVRFTYESRVDTQTTYVAGTPFSSTVRLTKLTTYLGNTVAREYRLDYGSTTSGTRRSRLMSVRECENSGIAASCLPATTFAWQEHTPGLTALGTTPTGMTDGSGWDSGLRYFNLDVNGDGKGDIVARDGAGYLYTWLSYGSTFGYAGATNTGYSDAGGWNAGLRYFTLDVNGDGKADLVARDAAGNLHTWLSNGTAFQYGGSTATGWTDASGWNDGLRYFVSDVDGDGRGDLLARHASGGVQTWLSNGATFVHAGTTATGYSDAGGWNSGLRFFSFDVNGDGRGDLVGRDGNGGLHTWLSNGTTLNYAGATATSMSDAAGWNAGQRFFVMDITGDGKAELVARDDSGNFNTWISTGSGFVQVASEWFGLSGSIWEQGLRFFVLDWNGDGRADLIARPPSGNLIALVSVGVTFDSGSGFGTGLTDDAGWNSGLRFFVMDANGDGKGDIVARAADGSLSTLSFSAAGQMPDLLASLTSGMGATTSVTYKPLTDPAAYTKDTTAAYPTLDLQAPTYVVSETSTSDGVGGQYRSVYSYFGAKSNAHGRGFLGFRWVQSQDPQSNITTRTTYRQDYPFVGLAEQVSTWAAAALSETTIGYAASALGGTRSFPYVTERTEKRWDLNGAFVSWVTATEQFDAYGNVTQSLIQSKDASGAADGNSRSIANTYSNNVSSWLLGRLTGSAVSSTVAGGASLTRTSAFAYDASGLLTQEVIEPGNPSLKLITDYGRDVFGNPIGITLRSDPAAPASAAIATRSASVTYDVQGRFPIRSRNALGHEETRTFDPRFGRLASSTDANGLVTTWAYDGFGRPVAESRADGTRTVTSYVPCASCGPLSRMYVDTAHLIIANNTYAAPPMKAHHDLLGRPIRTLTKGFDGLEVRRDIQYDTRGRVVAASRAFSGSVASHWTQFAYDDLNRVTSETAPDGGITTYAYDGRSTSMTNALGQTATRMLNSQGQLAQVIDAAGGVTRYDYDAFGNLVRTTDPASNVITLSYDLRGRKTSMADPDTGTSSYTYNVLGELVSQTDAKGQTSTMAYDKLSRLTRRSEPDLVSNWYYDTKKGGAACAKGIGKLCEAEADNGYRRVLSYDSLGRPIGTTTTIDAAYNAAVGYDGAGRLATLTYPTGFALKYVYNARGYLAEVRNNATNALYWKANAANADGQITAESLGNGLSITRSFEAASGRLAQVMSAGSTTVHDQRYGYDVLGNLISRSDAVQGVAESFGYDQLNRLVSASGTNAPAKSVSYDALGNIVAKSDVGAYAYGAKPHAVSGITGTLNGIANPSFSYDANGNLTSGAGRSFTWTSFDQPATITQGATSASFLYGPEHQRVKQSAAGTTTIYLFDPHYEKETTSAGTEHKHYLYAGSQLIGLHTQRANGTNDTRYVHNDHLDSVSVVTNEAGQVVERLAYDAWGKRRQPSGADDPNNAIRPALDRGYTGHEQLDAGGMGLIHMNGRLYDPQLARVLSPDPIIQAPGFSQSYNRYSYVWNNPLKYVDPGGYQLTVAPTVEVTADCCGVLPEYRTARWYSYCTGCDDSWGQPASFTDLLSGPGSPGLIGGTSQPVAAFSNVLSGYGGSGATIFSQGGSNGAGGTPISTVTSTHTTNNTSSGFSSSTTVTFISSSGGNGCTTSCTVGTPTTGTATGGNSQSVSTGNGIIGAASSIVGIFPQNAPVLAIGQAFGGLAAYAQGIVTGDDALANAALDGMSENRQRYIDTVLMLGTMGRTGAAKGAGEAERLVIGRGADLAKPGALGPGEFKFTWPPTGAVQTEWKVNSGLLRQEMRNERPIRDASVGNTGGMYLNAERNLLSDRGWTFDANTSLWKPPGR